MRERETNFIVKYIVLCSITVLSWNVASFRLNFAKTTPREIKGSLAIGKDVRDGVPVFQAPFIQDDILSLDLLD